MRGARGAAAGGQGQTACRAGQTLTVSRLISPPPRRHSGLAGLPIPRNGSPPRNGSQRRAKQIFSSFRKLTCSRTLRLQRRRGCDCKDGAVGLHQAGAQQRKRGGHGCSSAAARTGDAARWCWRQGHRALQRACACFLPQRHCARRGADSFSLHAHWSRAHPGKPANPSAR